MKRLFTGVIVACLASVAACGGHTAPAANPDNQGGAEPAVGGDQYGGAAYGQDCPPIGSDLPQPEGCHFASITGSGE